MSAFASTSTTANSQTSTEISLTKSQRKVAGHLRLLSSISGEPVELLAIMLNASLPVVAALSAEQRAVA